MDKKFLYCYKMTHDTGFAPNPEHDVLTLATCKPTVRRCAEIGTWISGWAGVKVYTTQDKKEYYTDKDQKLIYLARITNKLSIADYWEQYPQKQPNCVNGVYDMGDNIYEPDGNDGFKLHDNGGGHNINNKNHDLSGRSVLICNEFYYFGVANALDVKRVIKEKTFNVPRCKKLLLDDNDNIAETIIKFVVDHRAQAKYYQAQEL